MPKRPEACALTPVDRNAHPHASGTGNVEMTPQRRRSSIPGVPITGGPSEFKRYALIGASVFTGFLVSVSVLRRELLDTDHAGRSMEQIIQVRLLANPRDTGHMAVAAPAPNRESEVEAALEPSDAPPEAETDAVSEPILSSPAPPASKADSQNDLPPTIRESLGASMANFRDDLQRHIAQFKRYPEAARKDLLHGVVELLFEMRQDGHLVGLWVTSSSGSAILDNAALETLRRAEPLPAIPPGLGDRLVVRLPVELTPR